MALSVETTTSTSGTSVASLTFAHTITSANKMVVTCGVGTAAGYTVSGVTFNGVAQSFVGAITDAVPWTRVEIWGKHTPSVTTANVVVTYTNTPNQCTAGATGFIDSATALGAASTNTTTATNPTVTVVDTANGDLVVGMMMTDGSASATSANGGTELWEAEDVGADTDSHAQYKTATGASTVMNWTNATSANYAAIGVAVKASGGGGLTTEYVAPITAQGFGKMIGLRYV